MTTLITVECNELMGRDRQLRQPWSDVRISFVREPGTSYQFEPTLVSRKRLDEDLAFERAQQRDHPGKDRSARMARLEKAIAALNIGAEFYVDGRSPEDKVPEIYTSNAYIDQAEAEEMLAYFLETQGLSEVGFQWIWPDVVCSVG